STQAVPSEPVVAVVRPRVTSAGCRCPNVTTMPETGRPAASVTWNVVTPVSWMPEPFNPKTPGAETVANTATGGPAGPTTTGPASVPPDGGPASVPPEDDGPWSVTRVPFATGDQLAVTTTLPAPQWGGSSVKSHA